MPENSQRVNLVVCVGGMCGVCGMCGMVGTVGTVCVV